MLNTIMDRDIRQIDSILFVVAREETCHVRGDKPAERGPKVECSTNSGSHVGVTDIPSIVREYT